MGNSFGNTLTLPQTIGSGDYLVSPSGLFHAVLTAGGNLIVARGGDPDPSQDSNPLWQSNTEQDVRDGDYAFGYNYLGDPREIAIFRRGVGAIEPFWRQDAVELQPQDKTFIVLEDDGSLQWRAYTVDGKTLWSSGVSDPPVSCQSILSIDYDVSNAVLSNQQPLSAADEQTVVNKTSTAQSSTLTLARTVTQTSSWSDAFGASITAGVTFEAGIPYVEEGKIDVSTMISNTYTNGGSRSTQMTVSATANVTVPPYCTYIAYMSGTQGQLTVPYVITGTFVLTSGAKVIGTSQGTYVGSCCYNFTTVIEEPSQSGSATQEAVSHRLRPQDVSIRLGTDILTANPIAAKARLDRVSGPIPPAGPGAAT